MKIRAKDFDMLVKLINEERQQHGSNGWPDQVIEIEQVEEDIKEGNLVSSLKICLTYSVRKKTYENKEFVRDHITTIEMFDTDEKRKVRLTRVINKDPDDNA